MEAVLWIVLGVLLAIAEAFTVSFLIIFFAVGALAAGGAAALGAPFLVQVVVFTVVSGLSVGAVRPMITRRLRQGELESGDTQFGLQGVEGTKGTVLEEVGADHGLIKIDGELWQARAFDHTDKYMPGERIRVIKLEGATAIVWRDELPDL
jgi:membrane protein implicated in regulation of membrane protease activity